MDFLKWGAAGILAVAFVGALIVNEPDPLMAGEDPVARLCGDPAADHGRAAIEAHIAAMLAAADEAHAALLQTMEPMHSDMMRGMTASDFEIAFVCSMIPHHQGAVEMARAAQRHGGDHWITGFAQDIIAHQEREIGEMRNWLARQAP